MTPTQLQAAAHKLYGRKKWKFKLADALAVNVSTIHRIMHRPEVPGPYEVAIRGLQANKKAMDGAAKLARKMGLVPRKKRKKVLKPRPKEKKVAKIPADDRPAVVRDVAIVGD